MAILSLNEVSNWDGSGVNISENEGVTLSPTTDGSMAMTIFNLSKKNDAGQAAITTGGQEPDIIPVPPLQNAPVIIVNDYHGNGITLTNISSQAPLFASTYGPGLPSINPGKLPDSGLFYPLNVYTALTTASKTSYQKLEFRAEKDYTVFVLFAGSDVTKICVNAPECVEGYDKCSASNSCIITNNWLGATLWVVNLSPFMSQGGTVSLTTL